MKTVFQHKEIIAGKFICCYLFSLLFILSSCKAQDSSNSSIKGFDTQQVIYKNKKYDIVKIDLRKVDVNLYWKNSDGELIRSLKNLKKEVESEGKELMFGMNAGMYLKNRNPQGLFIQNGKTIKSLDTIQSGYGNFYLQPNGVFFIKNKKAGVIPTTNFHSKNIQPDFATQSGPMLLINGKVHPIFKEGSKHLNIRNGVGIISDHEIVFAISNEKINLFDFAMFFKEKWKCENALYLDGFVSRAYIPSLQRFDLDGNFGVMIGIKK